MISPKINNQMFRDAGRVVFLVALFTGLAFFLKRPHIRDYFLNIQYMRTVLSGGTGTGLVFSALLFVLMWGGLIAAGIPRLWASAVGGVIYGAFLGSVISLLASLVGATLLYGAGISLLAGIVERRVGQTLNLWRTRFQENAFWWVLYGRLFPFSNSTLMSLLCGSCRVPFRAFLTGSFLGFIPLAVVFATFGSGGIKGNFGQIGFAAALLVLSILSRKLLKKWFPEILKETRVYHA